MEETLDVNDVVVSECEDYVFMVGMDRKRLNIHCFSSKNKLTQLLHVQIIENNL